MIGDVGRRLAELRRARGWTQDDWAAALGVSVQYVRRLEAGENLTLRSLVLLACSLRVRTRKLLDPPATRARRRPGRPRTRAS